MDKTEAALVNLRAARDAVLGELANASGVAAAALAAADDQVSGEVQAVADSLNAAVAPPAPPAEDPPAA